MVKIGVENWIKNIKKLLKCEFCYDKIVIQEQPAENL